MQAALVKPKFHPGCLHDVALNLNQGCPLCKQNAHCCCNPSGLEMRLISAFSQGGAHVRIAHLLCWAIHEQLYEGGWIKDASAPIGWLTMVCVWEGFYGRLPASGFTRRGRSLTSSPPAPFKLSVPVLLCRFIQIFIFIHDFCAVASHRLFMQIRQPPRHINKKSNKKNIWMLKLVTEKINTFSLFICADITLFFIWS